MTTTTVPLPAAITELRRRFDAGGTASWSELRRASGALLDAWDHSGLLLVDPTAAAVLALGDPITWADHAPPGWDSPGGTDKPALMTARANYARAVDAALAARFALALVAFAPDGRRWLLPPTRWEFAAGDGAHDFGSGAWQATTVYGEVRPLLPTLA